jgi:hypothetical protein
MGYPEVFHRFCGYLWAAKKFREIFSCDDSLALSSGRRMNFASLAKKSSAISRALLRHCRAPPAFPRTRKSIRLPTFAATTLAPVARSVQLRNFAAKIPSRASIS